jgi:adenylate cyclase
MGTSNEIEIERRFLLRRLPSFGSGGPVEEQRVHQYYLNPKGSKVVERVRCTIIDNFPYEGNTYKYYHTTKERISDMSVKEIEREITSEEFEKLREGFDRSIHKRRLLYQVDDLKWEIDDFDDNDDQLIIAEIELPSEDYDLQIPEWLEKIILLEITGMNQFSNSNLAF